MNIKPTRHSINVSTCSRNKLVIITLVLLTLMGCNSIQHQPFADFNTAAVQLAGVDAPLATHAKELRDSEMRSQALNPDFITSLTLEFDAVNAYAYHFTQTENEPLFIKFYRLQTGLKELNNVFIDYTALLVKLAGNDINDKQSFDQLALALNENSSKALAALNVKVDANKLGIFSKLATHLVYKQINGKRKDYLQQIIQANQTSVDEFVASAQSALSIVAREIQAEYLLILRQKFKQLAKDKSSNTAEDIFTFSNQTAKTLDVLQAFDKTYGAFSATHKSLINSLENKSMSISDLMVKIKYLQKTLQKLTQNE